MAKPRKGLIHIYCGENKGKTTACVGLAIRAHGSKFRVIFCQFLKSAPSGEVDVLKSLGIDYRKADIPWGFTWEMSASELDKLREGHNNLLKDLIELFKTDSGEKTLLILDEAVGCYENDFIDKELLLNFLKNKPEELEIVLSGRGNNNNLPADELMEVADYITEMRKIKHPMDKGVNSRKGIEY